MENIKIIYTNIEQNIDTDECQCNSELHIKDIEDLSFFRGRANRGYNGVVHDPNCEGCKK